MRDHLNDQVHCLQTLVDGLDDRDLADLTARCLSVLEAGRKLVLTGLGKTVPVCEKVVGTLHSVGLPAAFVHANTAVHGDLGAIGPGDLVLVLSKSGGTSETLELVRHLKERQTQVIALVFAPESALEALADRTIRLRLTREERIWGVLPCNSTLGFLCVLQGLVLALVEALGIDERVFLSNHPGGMIGQKVTE